MLFGDIVKDIFLTFDSMIEYQNQKSRRQEGNRNTHDQSWCEQAPEEMSVTRGFELIMQCGINVVLNRSRQGPPGLCSQCGCLVTEVEAGDRLFGEARAFLFFEDRLWACII